MPAENTSNGREESAVKLEETKTTIEESDDNIIYIRSNGEASADNDGTKVNSTVDCNSTVDFNSTVDCYSTVDCNVMGAEVKTQLIILPKTDLVQIT